MMDTGRIAANPEILIFLALRRRSTVWHLRWRPRHDRVHQHVSQVHAIVTVTWATAPDKDLTVHDTLELLQQYVLPLEAQGHPDVTDL